MYVYWPRIPGGNNSNCVDIAENFAAFCEIIWLKVPVIAFFSSNKPLAINMQDICFHGDKLTCVQCVATWVHRPSRGFRGSPAREHRSLAQKKEATRTATGRLATTVSSLSRSETTGYAMSIATANSTKLREKIWRGSIPLEVRLASNESRTYDKTDPYIVSYLDRTKCIPSLILSY